MQHELTNRLQARRDGASVSPLDMIGPECLRWDLWRRRMTGVSHSPLDQITGANAGGLRQSAIRRRCPPRRWVLAFGPGKWASYLKPDCSHCEQRHVSKIILPHAMKSRNTSKWSRTALLFTAVFSGQLLAENLLQNPGFETGSLSGWTISGTANPAVGRDGTPIPGTWLPDNEVNVHAGEFSGWTRLFYGSLSGQPNVDLTLSQRVLVAPNTTYRIGYWFSAGTTPQPLAFGGHIRVNGEVPPYLWDGVETISYPQVPHPFVGRTPGNYTHLETFFKTDAGTRELSVDFVLNGNGVPVGFSFDDFSVEAIPEPTTVSLLTLGGCLLLWRMRRKSGV